MTLPGVSEDRVDQFLALRSGPDGIDGTEDDWVPQRGIADVELALGSPPGQLSALGVVYSPQDAVWRVISVGKSGEVTKTVRMVFLRQPLQLKSWKEF